VLSAAPSTPASGSRDGTAIRLRAGDTVWTPAGEEHWHGGTAENMMCHYAILDQTPAGDATR
jgi:quercetin dioxygenase-like cupin family protein